MTNSTVTVSVADVYRDLSDCIAIHGAFEQMVLTEIKQRFVRAGISFYDRIGLYPIPPYQMSSVMERSGLQIITIKQQRFD